MRSNGADTLHACVTLDLPIKAAGRVMPPPQLCQGFVTKAGAYQPAMRNMQHHLHLQALGAEWRPVCRLLFIYYRKPLLALQQSCTPHCDVTCQVTARPGGPTTHAFQQQRQTVPSGAAKDGQLSAALGTKWAHAVNIRMVLERWQERRFIKVCTDRAGLAQAFLPHAPARGCSLCWSTSSNKLRFVPLERSVLNGNL